jgi:hypothetical protein
MAATLPFYFPSGDNAPAGLPEALALFAQRRAQQMPAQQPPEVQGRLAAGLPSGGFWNSAGAPLPPLPARARPQPSPPPAGLQQALAYAAEPPKPAMPAAVGAMPPAAPASPAGAPAQGGNWWEQFSNSGGRDFLGNALTDLGAGLASGRDWQEGLGIATQRMAQLGPQRQQGRQDRQQQNATMEYLAREAPDLAEMVAAGMPATAALSEAMRRRTPTSPDPFTLGKGDIRFDGNGNIIAQAGEGGPETVINNNIGGTDEFYKKLDTDAGAQQAALIDAGRNAQSNNMRLGQLEQHLANAPQGAQGALVQFAGQFGIPVEGLNDVQAAQALINQMVPGQRPAGSGTMSDADLALFKQSLPAIANQPGGNQAIIRTTKAINDYTIQQALIAQQVANREISPAEGRARQAAIPNPLAKFVGAENPKSSGDYTIIEVN